MLCVWVYWTWEKIKGILVKNIEKGIGSSSEEVNCPNHHILAIVLNLLQHINRVHPGETDNSSEIEQIQDFALASPINFIRDFENIIYIRVVELD